MFDLEVVLFNGATEGKNVTNMNAVDVSLKLMIGRMKAVYLHRFIMDLLVCSHSFSFLRCALLSFFFLVNILI